MFKDLAMRVFLVHLAAFVAGTLICAAVNFWLTPGTLWLPWVLIGWGALVATHALALLLAQDPAARAHLHRPQGARASPSICSPISPRC